MPGIGIVTSEPTQRNAKFYAELVTSVILALITAHIFIMMIDRMIGNNENDTIILFALGVILLIFSIIFLTRTFGEKVQPSQD